MKIASPPMASRAAREGVAARAGGDGFEQRLLAAQAQHLSRGADARYSVITFDSGRA